MAFASISTDAITHRGPRRSKLNIVELRAAPSFCEAGELAEFDRRTGSLSGKLRLAFLQEALDGFLHIGAIQQLSQGVNLQVLTIAHG